MYWVFFIETLNDETCSVIQFIRKKATIKKMQGVLTFSKHVEKKILKKKDTSLSPMEVKQLESQPAL